VVPSVNTSNTLASFLSQINDVVEAPTSGVHRDHHHSTTITGTWEAQARLVEENSLLWRMVINLKRELAALRARLPVGGNHIEH